MAETLEEFLDWLERHPQAELVVADDVYTQISNRSDQQQENMAPTLCGRAIGTRIHHSAALKPGTMIGMEPSKIPRLDEPPFESLTIGGK